MDEIIVGSDTDCIQEFSMVYVQFTCSDPDGRHRKMLVGLFVTISGIICCTIFRFQIFYLKMTARMDEKILNAKTVTTSDFSLKMEINIEIYKEWLKLDDGTAFDDWFQAQIENEILKLDCEDHSRV